MYLLPLTLFFFSLGLEVAAGDGINGSACSVGDQRLEVGTYQFSSDCDSMWYCAGTGICEWKTCRRDEYPFGYTSNVTLPPRCDTGFFCPDEEDSCQQVLSVGSPCQFNRDDECEGPPNSKELADHSGFGRNVNGSICLNNVCQWANKTLGDVCEVQNTAYIVYAGSAEYIDIVSRDNCQIGFWCDAQSLACMQTKDIGVTCDADKECSSYNCLASGVCGVSGDTPRHVAFWVYIVVGIGIFAGMFGTLVGMFFLHKGQRDEEREKRLQYWREQSAFRQNIIQMQETARHSIMTLSGASPRDTMYSKDAISSEDSHMPMLHSAGKSSGLRHYVSDEGMGSEESIMMQRQ